MSHDPDWSDNAAEVSARLRPARRSLWVPLVILAFAIAFWSAAVLITGGP